jgi:hypothetical protein
MLEPYVDALDVSAGNYDTAMTLLPMVPPGSLVNYAKLVKQQVSVPVIGVGRLTWLLDDMAAAIDQGELDFVALGRAGLADPETAVKTQRGEPQRVRRCLAVNECISRWMFKGQSTQCVINPTLGQERRASSRRAATWRIRSGCWWSAAGPPGARQRSWPPTGVTRSSSWNSPTASVGSCTPGPRRACSGPRSST